MIGSSSYVSGRGVDVPISSLRSQHGEESIHDAMHRQRMEQEQSKRGTTQTNCTFDIVFRNSITKLPVLHQEQCQLQVCSGEPAA